MTILETSLAGIKFKNPIIPASGCFGFGKDYAKFYDLNLLGGIAVKATSIEPRKGNLTPRVAETESGMLNSIGLQNPGLEKVISDELSFVKDFDTNIFANVVGNSIEDYIEVSETLSKSGLVHAIELNVSCPNVKNGIQFGSNEDMLETLTREVKAVSCVPVFVKLSPNVTNIIAMAKAAQKGGTDGLSMINTLLGMRIDLKTKKPILARGSGGLSGPAIKPVAIRMIYEVAKEIPTMPIIGMGGICSVEDILEFAYAGASAFGIGTFNFVEPYACPELINALEKRLIELGYASINDLVGLAWK